MSFGEEARGVGEQGVREEATEDKVGQEEVRIGLYSLKG